MFHKGLYQLIEFSLFYCEGYIIEVIIIFENCQLNLYYAINLSSNQLIVKYVLIKYTISPSIDCLIFF